VLAHTLIFFHQLTHAYTTHTHTHTHTHTEREREETCIERIYKVSARKWPSVPTAHWNIMSKGVCSFSTTTRLLTGHSNLAESKKTKKQKKTHVKAVQRDVPLKPPATVHGGKQGEKNRAPSYRQLVCGNKIVREQRCHTSRAVCDNLLVGQLHGLLVLRYSSCSIHLSVCQIASDPFRQR